MIKTLRFHDFIAHQTSQLLNIKRIILTFFDVVLGAGSMISGTLELRSAWPPVQDGSWRFTVLFQQYFLRIFGDILVDLWIFSLSIVLF